MKRVIAITLMLLLLCGCGMNERPADWHPADTGVQQLSAAPAAADTDSSVPTEQPSAPETEPVTEPATEPTEAPTEPPIPFNPLNGTILEEPYTGRIYASTISNIESALPHVGVNDADILLEMYVNSSIIRDLALFTSIQDLESIGSVRSTRPMFNQIAQHYDVILVHAGGSDQALGDAASRGIDNYNIDKWNKDAHYSFRDPDRERYIGYEHCLMGNGNGIIEFMTAQGMRQEQSPDKDYGLRFTDDGTPADGEDAEKISVTITYGKAKKETIMLYDPALGKYVYHQYGKAMADGTTGEPEAFRNVIIMHTNISMSGIYHMADFSLGGTGYFACGGKLVPIKWTCESDVSPFEYWLMDGTRLELGRGNTYIAVCSPDSPVTYGLVESPAETAEAAA